MGLHLIQNLRTWKAFRKAEKLFDGRPHPNKEELKEIRGAVDARMKFLQRQGKWKKGMKTLTGLVEKAANKPELESLQEFAGLQYQYASQLLREASLAGWGGVNIGYSVGMELSRSAGRAQKQVLKEIRDIGIEETREQWIRENRTYYLESVDKLFGLAGKTLGTFVSLKMGGENQYLAGIELTKLKNGVWVHSDRLEKYGVKEKVENH